MSTAATESTQDTRPFVQRVPQSLFIAVYGTLIILTVVGAVFAVRYTADAESSAEETTQTARSFTPAPADPENVAASVRPYLIENLKVGTTKTGVMARGDIAEQAVADPTEFAGHVSRLLEQNCLDTLTLTTPEGMRLNFWGFCFTTIPEQTIYDFFRFAETEDADAVSFAKFFAQQGVQYAKLTWMDADSTGKDPRALKRTWNRLQRPEEIERMTFYGYYDDEVVVMTNDANNGKNTESSPAGEAFEEKWGLKR